MYIFSVSKEIMSTSSVPVVPGYFGKDQSNEYLQLEADKIGYVITTVYPQLSKQLCASYMI